jgi:type III pantothenate kinase
MSHDESVTVLVDAGNSRVKWAIAQAERIEYGEAFRSSAAGLADGLSAVWAGLPPPAQVVVGNVAGAAVGEAITAWTQAHWGLTPHFAASAPCACGVYNGYDAPEKLGVDRWAALIGARGRVRGAVCVADCGTAITVDLLDAGGRHLGGWIVPGLTLMRETLAEKARLTDNASAVLAGVWGRNTAEGLAGGARQAGAGLIERAFQAATDFLGGAPELVLTGGDAKSLGRLLRVPYHPVPNLVIEGLWALARQTS